MAKNEIRSFKKEKKEKEINYYLLRDRSLFAIVTAVDLHVGCVTDNISEVKCLVQGQPVPLIRCQPQ